MSTASLRKKYADALHDIITKWTDEHPDQEIDHELIAQQAIDEGSWQPRRRNLVRELAKQLARVTGARQEKNEQGVTVKKYRAATKEVVINGKKIQKSFWQERKKMSADHAHMSFRQEWDQIAGHCKSLNNSQTDFNVNNPNSLGHESQLQFDFTMIVDAPSEQQIVKIAANLTRDEGHIDEIPRKVKPR